VRLTRRETAFASQRMVGQHQNLAPLFVSGSVYGHQRLADERRFGPWLGPAHRHTSGMDDVTVRRVDFGYFVRPPEETGTGEPRVEPCLGYLVVHPEGTLLFDTGMGGDPGVDQHYRPRRTGLELALSTVDVSVDDIDLVANCHLHFDHCGGNVRATERRFRKAIATLNRSPAGLGQDHRSQSRSMTALGTPASVSRSPTISATEVLSTPTVPLISSALHEMVRGMGTRTRYEFWPPTRQRVGVGRTSSPDTEIRLRCVRSPIRMRAWTVDRRLL
jgi:hypothetical protein